MQHTAQLVVEIRETEATPDGWAQYEDTGRACLVCPCGTVTGFIGKQEALQTYREHGASLPLAEPVPLPRTDVHVDLSLNTAEGEHAMRNLIQKITRA